MHISKAAQTALTKLEDRRGRLRPPDVVKAARPKGSPLHGYFEWNDGRAAELFRLEQAKQIIRKVTLVIETTERTLTAVAYVHDPETLGSRYQNVVRMEPAGARDMMRAELEAIALDIGRAEALAYAKADALPKMGIKLGALRSRAEALVAEL
jgi:hypothetical protein